MKTMLKTLAVAVMIAQIVWAAPITLGNLLIFRVDGNGAALGSDAAIVYVDEYTTNGTFVQSFQMPSSGSGTKLTASGTATSEGKFTFSPNGAYLALIGYDAAENTANVKGTINRTIARIKTSDGSVDLSTTGPLGGTDNARGVTVNNDGTKFWAAVTGTGQGPRYIPFGSTVAGTQLVDANARGCVIYDNQLYTFGDATTIYGVGTVGSGLPETSGQSISGLPGISGDSALNTYGFVMFDLDATEPGYDTLYMARDTTGASKYSKVSGTWTLNNTVDPGSVFHITGIRESGNNVSIYIVEGDGDNATRIMKMTDTAGYNANMSEAAFTEIIPDGANQRFRGVAIAPIPEPGLIGMGVLGLVAFLRRK